MNSRLVRTFSTLTLCFVLFNSSTFACGPFTMEAVFTFTVHPAYPMERYAKGEIGIIQPSYARSYLYVAYRYLSNFPFNAQEQKALAELWHDRLNNDSYASGEEWVKAWLDARQKVAGTLPAPKIDVFRNREKPNEYESYLNCRKDSFDSAIATLEQRVKKYGADNPAVRTWIEGQDEVFANCSEGQHVPSALVATEDALAQADRSYQIAAANFYATKFDEARKGFEAITTDSSSPWQISAPYLVARTLVRKASLGPEESSNTSYSEAENQLKTILADTKLSSTHAAAQRLLDLVRLRLHPADRLHELARTLINKKANDQLKQDLWDYTVLLDSVLEPDDPAKPKVSKDEVRTEDLTDWIATLQGKANGDTEHALSRWQSTHSAAWLIAALSKIDGKNTLTANLVREALNVKPGSSAFVTARFHAVRLLTESGKSNESRSLLDQLLKNNRAQFDASALNLLISERMAVATSLADFLSHASRIPAALSWNDDGREIPSESSEVADENKKLIGKPLFDYDAAQFLNTQMPLSILKEAVSNQSLPNHLRRDLAQAVWIRAVLVGDYQTADELVPVLKNLVPDLVGGLDDFLKTTPPEAKKFSALYTWLKFPGVEPIVAAGIGREDPLQKQDSYRDNWWCNASFTPPTEPVEEDKYDIPSFTSRSIQGPLFLTDAERTIGQKEWKTLSALGAMPNYLCKQVIQWANNNPRDPRAPEALHLAVNATRHGCTDEQTGRWSKAAFDLLHRKYPNTTWAKKTKYWFKE